MAIPLTMYMVTSSVMPSNTGDVKIRPVKCAFNASEWAATIFNSLAPIFIPGWLLLSFKWTHQKQKRKEKNQIIPYSVVRFSLKEKIIEKDKTWEKFWLFYQQYMHRIQIVSEIFTLKWPRKVNCPFYDLKMIFDRLELAFDRTKIDVVISMTDIWVWMHPGLSWN